VRDEEEEGVYRSSDDIPRSDVGSSVERSVGLVAPNEGEPIGVSSGENRSAAQMKFEDSTVLHMKH